MIVAIDGPAGSGKSTTARRVANRLGWLYLDTGAMYRAVGVAFAEREVPFTEEAAAQLMPDLTVDLTITDEGTRVVVNGTDVTHRIRTPAATRAASRVSALRSVRKAMVDLQRRIAQAQSADGGGVVIEGRDIGTVVFPEAEVKIFLTADLDARARRRFAEQPDADVPTLDEIKRDLRERDERDATRPLSPLQASPDAYRLDTTGLDIQEQVEAVIRHVEHVRQITRP